MTLTFHALWMLCGSGAAVFATAVACGDRRGFDWLALAAGFAVTAFWLTAGRSADPAWVGCSVAAVAACHLFKPGRHLVMTASAGALAAILASLLHIQGVPSRLALAVSALLPLTSAYLSQRTPSFAPPIVRDEAIVGVTALAVIVAVAPTVAQGWQSAVVLNIPQTGGAPAVLPVWLVFVSWCR